MSAIAVPVVIAGGGAGLTASMLCRSLASSRGPQDLGHGASRVLSDDYIDIRCTWLKQREISAKGAVLVRRDRYIAWRSVDAVDNPNEVLQHVFPGSSTDPRSRSHQHESTCAATKR